ncbi:MAG: hypothetical protein ACI9JY_000740, partial [Saprospiraceae bacterium]
MSYLCYKKRTIDAFYIEFIINNSSLKTSVRREQNSGRIVVSPG